MAEYQKKIGITLVRLNSKSVNDPVTNVELITALKLFGRPSSVLGI